jgi:hypothetical protein
MISLLILADDFTGALDTGVQFAKRGMTVRVLTADRLSFSKPPDIDALVVDAETRHISPEDAYGGTFELVRKLGPFAEHIYIKTDSGLRGNIGSVLKAAMDASGVDFLPFIPAYPDTGRITENGVHYVNGVPVNESVFGSDPFNPVKSPLVKDLFAGLGVGAAVFGKTDKFSADFLEPTIGIFDVSENGDFHRIAERLKEQNRLSVTAGCAGFAGVLPDYIGLGEIKPVSSPRVGPARKSNRSPNRSSEARRRSSIIRTMAFSYRR